MFPIDAKTFATTTPGSGGTACPDLLASSSSVRTILQAYISTDGANEAKIKIGDNTYLETQQNRLVRIETPQVIPADTKITCERANNKPYQFIITYLDRDIRILPAPETGQAFYNGFSYGELILSVFIYLIFVLLLAKFVLTLFKRK